jgi:hypothetical protein
MKNRSVLLAWMLPFVLLNSSQGVDDSVSSRWQGLVRVRSCAPSLADEPVIRGGDFSWNQSLAEISERAQRLYLEGKRLKSRAFVNEQGEVVVPHVRSTIVREVKLEPHFILSVRRHIEEALRLGYVDEIIFSDMGHAHFFMPWDFYNEVILPIGIDETHIRYELMLAYEGLKMLYHTAEQLEMLDEDRKLINDRKVQWRFFTRNLVGDNRAEGRLELLHNETHSHNTGRSYEEGYRYWGAGFYITANKDGCFPFVHNGAVRYFDLNLHGFDY